MDEHIFNYSVIKWPDPVTAHAILDLELSLPAVPPVGFATSNHLEFSFFLLNILIKISLLIYNSQTLLILLIK